MAHSTKGPFTFILILSSGVSFFFFYVIFLYGHFSLNTEHIVKLIFLDSIIFDYHISDKERFLLY